MINNVKTFVLLAGMLSLCLALGQVIGGSGGMMIGGFIGVIMAFVSFWFSDTMVLRGYKARVVTEKEAPELYRMIDELRQRAGLPMPRVAIVPSSQPNAFATGRSYNKAVVAVTEGIMRTLPRDELAGVIAHELAHIKNRDMLISTVAAGMAALLSHAPWVLMHAMGRGDREGGNGLGQIAMVIIAPIAAMILQFAISRQREFVADRTGAEILGQAKPLAQALTRIEAMARQIPMDVDPAYAPLAQVNPLRGGGMMKLFSTHPPTEERVKALLALDAGR